MPELEQDAAQVLPLVVSVPYCQHYVSQGLRRGVVVTGVGETIPVCVCVCGADALVNRKISSRGVTVCGRQRWSSQDRGYGHVPNAL